MLFVQVRENKNTEGLKIFGHEFKLSAFADGTTYFVKHEVAAQELKKLFNDFAEFSSLRINSDKIEVCGIGVKKGDSRALLGFKLVDLTRESTLILCSHHSYHKTLALDRNFLTLVDNIQAVLNLWANRGLSLGGKVLVFKTLGISKMQYLAQMTLIPKHTIQKLIDIQEKILWQNGKPKIKHPTLTADYKDGSLKVVDIDSKFRALMLTWLKRLCDDNEHPWKIIPQAYLKLPNGGILFHKNFSTDETTLNKIKGIPKFYVEIFKIWGNFSENSSDDPTVLLSESLWLKRFIKIGNKSVFT